MFLANIGTAFPYERRLLSCFEVKGVFCTPTLPVQKKHILHGFVANHTFANLLLNETFLCVSLEKDCSLTECDYTCPTEDSPITESKGVLMSWRHPRILPPAYSCRWTIISKPNVYVRLDFFSVSVEAHYPIKVFARRLNGSQLNENSYVTVTSPVWIMSETTKVIITYETGLMHKANGFRVHHGPTAGNFLHPWSSECVPSDLTRDGTGLG